MGRVVLLLVKDFDGDHGQAVYCKKLVESSSRTKFLVLSTGYSDEVVESGNCKVFKSRVLIGADNFFNWTIVMNNALRSSFQKLRDEFDIIHCNDWECFPTALLIKKVTGKPLITTVHSTEEMRGFSSPYSHLVKHIESDVFKGSDLVVSPVQISGCRTVLPEQMEEVYNGL